MKVLLVNKFHYKKGGSETYYFTLAQALQARGHQVIFFAMQDEKNLPCDQAQYFVSNASVGGGIKSRLNMLLHLVYSGEAYQKMKALLAAEKPELVVLNLVHKQITLSIIDAIREYDAKIPIFWTMHDLITVCPSYLMLDGQGNICEKCLDGNFGHCAKNRCVRGSRLMSLLSTYEAEQIRRRKWYEQVDLYICPSAFYREKLIFGGFPADKLVKMRNPLPLDTEFGGGQRGDYVLYFGRLSREKGVKLLIDAVKQIGCRLVILGTGPAEAELREYAGAADNIEFKGFQTGAPLKSYVKNSACVVLPSQWYENGPYSAMEAMAVGKPLVVSDQGGLPELVEDGVNGYVCHGGSAALAESLSRLLALDGDTYEEMSRNAMQMAGMKFDAMQYVERLEGLYAERKGR